MASCLMVLRILIAEHGPFYKIEKNTLYSFIQRTIVKNKKNLRVKPCFQRVWPMLDQFLLELNWCKLLAIWKNWKNKICLYKFQVEEIRFVLFSRWQNIFSPITKFFSRMTLTLDSKVDSSGWVDRNMHQPSTRILPILPELLYHSTKRRVI